MSEIAILQAKSHVLDACNRLVSGGLVARTWGNISCRVNNKYFVITPSGKSYDLLKHEDLVVVNIFDMNYKGNIKPSSEKGIHAQVYKKFKDINCVIHTHQCYATAYSVCSQEQLYDLSKYDIDINNIKIAKYGLPGTKKLCKNVSSVTEVNSTILLRNHGVLVYENTLDLAFEKALSLEEKCRKCFNNYYTYIPQSTEIQVLKREDCLNNISYSEENYLYTICKSVFKLNNNINIIGILSNNLIKEFSIKKYIPILDDFAQMFGVYVNCISDKRTLKNKYIRGKNSLFIKNKCILCFAKDMDELRDQTKLVEKELITAKNAKQYNVSCKLSFLDRLIMRFVYIKKYSRLK